MLIRRFLTIAHPGHDRLKGSYPYGSQVLQMKQEPKSFKVLLLIQTHLMQYLPRGHSGIRPLVVEKIIEFLNADIIAAC
jgi:hypothetical protein